MKNEKVFKYLKANLFKIYLSKNNLTVYFYYPRPK